MQAAGRLPMRCRSSAGPELYLPDRNSCAAYDSICQPASPTATDATPQLPDGLSTVVKQRCCRTQEGAGLLAGPAAAWRHREGGSWSAVRPECCWQRACAVSAWTPATTGQRRRLWQQQPWCLRGQVSPTVAAWREVAQAPALRKGAARGH